MAFFNSFAKNFSQNVKEIFKILPDKLPKPSGYAPQNDPQTQEEWERYFDYRKNDRDYPDENKNKFLQTIKARGKLVWPKTDLMLLIRWSQIMKYHAPHYKTVVQYA